MKALILITLLAISSGVQASVRGPLYPTSEEAERACRMEAARQQRRYMISAYYNFRGEFQGWVCHLGSRDK